MSSNCDKMRDRVADLVTGILPETEAHALQQHLSECPACRDYSRTLQEEDQLLAGFFAQSSADMTSRQDSVISTINRFEPSGETNIISVGGMILRSILERHSAAAAVIVVVTLYFLITWSWISKINRCIELSGENLRSISVSAIMTTPESLGSVTEQIIYGKTYSKT